MSLAEQVNSPGRDVDEPGTLRQVVVADVLEFKRCHPPRAALPTNEAFEPADMCLRVMPDNLAAYGLVGEPEWVSYAAILGDFASKVAGGSRSHISPYPRKWVFDTPLVMVSERASTRLTASVVFQPAYAWRAKVGVPRPGISWEMVCGAVAVLNTRFGHAAYQRVRGHDRSQELSMAALNRVPVQRGSGQISVQKSLCDLVQSLQVILGLGRELMGNECLAALNSTGLVEPLRASLRRMVDNLQARVDAEVQTLLRLSERGAEEWLSGATVTQPPSLFWLDELLRPSSAQAVSYEARELLKRLDEHGSTNGVCFEAAGSWKLVCEAFEVVVRR